MNLENYHFWLQDTQEVFFYKYIIVIVRKPFFKIAVRASWEPSGSMC